MPRRILPTGPFKPVLASRDGVQKSGLPKRAKSARYGQILKPPFAAGQSMKTVCAWLAKDAGITLGLSSLTSYVSRIRRRESIKSEAGVAGGQVSARWPGLSSLIGCGLWR